MTFLRSLDPVVSHFPQASQNSVQDITDRGVDLRALDDFVFDCITRAMEARVPGDRVTYMIACSCFHMGMLAQDYLSQQEEDDDDL